MSYNAQNVSLDNKVTLHLSPPNLVQNVSDKDRKQEEHKR